MQKVRIPEATAIAASDCYTQNRLCHTEKKLKNTIKLQTTNVLYLHQTTGTFTTT